MKAARRPLAQGALATVLCAAACATAIAQVASGGGFVLEAGRAGPGGRAEAAPFALEQSIAQPEAQAPATGGGFQLQGGLQRPASALAARVFADGFEG